MLGTVSTLSELLNFKTSTEAFYGEAAEGFYCFLSSGRAETEAASEAVHNKITGFSSEVARESAKLKSPSSPSSTTQAKPQWPQVKLTFPGFVFDSADEFPIQLNLPAEILNSPEFETLNISVDPIQLNKRFPLNPLLSLDDSILGSFKRKVQPDGKLYMGQFIGSKRSGYGTQKYKDGTWYEGQFDEDKKHGYGVRWFINRLKAVIHEGLKPNRSEEVKSHEDSPCNGDESSRRLMYCGSFSADEKNGTGCLIWENGRLYIGNLSSGFRDDYGLQCNPDGSFYVGSFSRGKYLKGLYVYRERKGGNRPYYRGWFFNNRKQGKGCYHFADKTKPPREGLWSAGRFCRATSTSSNII